MTDTTPMMSCIEITTPGGPDVLQPTQRNRPSPGPGELLIKVAAAGINRPDVMQREGHYAPPPGASDIPGLEVAGSVAALGPGVSAWKEGDLLCALVAGGGYAEYCLAPALQCLPIPGALDLVQAAAIPETFFTVWVNVFERAALKEGETLMVHGGTSGIGTTAIQMAKSFGARIIATAGNDEKCQACLDLGADLAVNYRNSDFVSAAKEFSAGKGVDVILDMVGGDYLEKNIASLATDGRLAIIAFLKGSKSEVDFSRVLFNRLTITGSTLRPLSVERKGKIAEALRKNVWPLIEAQKISPQIHTTFPLSDASKAHELMESSKHIGKIVLTT
jgi:NADPH:quinone reductase